MRKKNYTIGDNRLSHRVGFSDAHILHLRMIGYKYHCARHVPQEHAPIGRYKHDYITVKRFGASHKMVYHSRNVVNSYKKPKYQRTTCESGGKLSNNLARARSRCFELAMCNDFEFFATFTLDRDKYDRYNLPKFRKDLAQFVRNANRKHGLAIKYLMIPEQHKDGAWHMHGLFMGISSCLECFEDGAPVDLIEKGYQNWKDYQRKFGFCSFDVIKNNEACAKYIVKYITKSLKAHETCENKIGYGEHLYYASQGLKGAELVFEGGIANADKLAWDFENEYVKVMWDSNEDFGKALSFDV